VGILVQPGHLDKIRANANLRTAVVLLAGKPHPTKPTADQGFFTAYLPIAGCFSTAAAHNPTLYSGAPVDCRSEPWASTAAPWLRTAVNHA
jgi:hypothetical protein